MEIPYGQRKSQPPVNDPVKILCSYGGRILPGFNDPNRLTYLGGDTRLLTVDRRLTFVDLIAKLTSLYSIADPFLLKYQIPGCDLDSLVLVTDDDDMSHMIFEHEPLFADPTRPGRVRMFMFEVEKSSSVSSNLTPDVMEEAKSEGSTSSPPPPLDLLQIPGMVVIGFSGSGSSLSSFSFSDDSMHLDNQEVAEEAKSGGSTSDPAFDLLQIPGMVVPGFPGLSLSSSSGSDDSVRLDKQVSEENNEEVDCNQKKD